MRYRRYPLSIRYDDGSIRRVEVHANPEDVRIFSGTQEIPRLAPGTSKSVYLPGATSKIAEDEYVFDLDGKFLCMRRNGRLRPIATAIDGFAKYLFGKNEILTVVCIGTLFFALILLAILL